MTQRSNPARTEPSISTPPMAVPVWDMAVRVFHWTLVVLVAIAAVTGFVADAPWIGLHIAAGVAATLLIGLRVIWGFTGSRHARFADFVVTPAHLFAHAIDLAKGRAGRHLGHNPPGGWMILALIATIAALALTGTVTLGGALRAGPLAADVGYAAGSAAKEIHEALAIALLALIAAHLAGVLIESLRTRENLVRAMVTGRKRPDPTVVPAAVPASAPVHARPVLTLAVGIVIAGAVVAVALQLAARPVPGLPRPMPQLVARECGACHFAYPASLLPKTSWTRLMAGLDDHFGENAALPADKAAAIAAYLDDNAAEAVDTKAANRLRAVDPAAPLSITATRFWRRTHADIADATFARREVGGKGNCAGCHADAATARFWPGAIRIP